MINQTWQVLGNKERLPSDRNGMMLDGLKPPTCFMPINKYGYIYCMFACICMSIVVLYSLYIYIYMYVMYVYIYKCL